MDSLDDIRDSYKHSRQSNDHKLRLNGATYRKIRNFAPSGNTITKTGYSTSSANADVLDEINEKYQLNQNRETYSLNKKKRWEVPKQLIENMEALAEDDHNVRLIETRNRNSRKANCVGIHKTKGDQVSVKKTYANLQSILKMEQQSEAKRLNPTPATETPVKKPNRFKIRNPKSTRNYDDFEEETIVIEDSRKKPTPTGDDTAFFQYEIEYAPKKDILKHGIRHANSTGMLAVGSRNKKYHELVNENGGFSEDISDSEVSNDEQEEMDELDIDSIENKDDTVQVEMTDLIDIKLRAIVDRAEKKLQLKEKSSAAEAESSSASTDLKDRKVFVDKSELNKYFFLDFKHKNAKAKKEKIVQAVIVQDPPSLNLKISDKSIESDYLKEKFGANLSEANNCWPRHFNINLTQDLTELITKRGETINQFDMFAWLRFAEIRNEEKPDGATLFQVSYCSNLNDLGTKITLSAIEKDGRTYDLGEVHSLALEYLAQLPLKEFRMLEKQKVEINRDNLTMDLPTISGKTIVKNMDDLKIDYVKNNQSKANEAAKTSTNETKVKFERLNSKEVVCVDEDLKEQDDVKKKVQAILDSRAYECAICLTERTDTNNCIVFTSCGHAMCNSCMKDYVNFILQDPINNSGKFNCPSCDKELGLPLLINYASSGHQVNLMIRHTIERVVFVLDNYKWCPNPNCSNILSLDLASNPYGTVSCSCGLKMCLKCNNQPHFPAKCSQISNYYSELKKNSEFFNEYLEYYVSQGKRCPSCNVFMEKNGGCNQMFCSMCREYFCWDCGKKWQKHLEMTGGQHACNKKNAKDFKTTIHFKAEMRKGASSNNAAHEKSVSHRRMRREVEKVFRVNQAKRLLGTIRLADFEEKFELDAKKSNNGLSKSESIVEKGRLYNDCRMEVEKFLFELITLINEIHFVCEYSYLLLRDESVDRDVRFRIASALKRLEIVVWGANYQLNYGNGFEAVNKLRVLHEKGLSLIRTLRVAEN